MRTKGVHCVELSGNEDVHAMFQPAMKILTFALMPAAALLFSGCGPHEHDHHHDHAGHDHAAHEHHHEAPHGGTAVVLGDEAFHLEFVRDGEAGSLSAYVLDGHMENFVRVTNEVIALQARDHGELKLMAAANTATGETVGDTSHFSATAGWLKTTTNFAAAITSVTIRGTVFTNVTFAFPEGNE